VGESIDRAVLCTLADDVLSPRVVEAVVAGVIEALGKETTEDAHAAAAAELVVVDRELARLTEAIATGGDIPALVGPCRYAGPVALSSWRSANPSDARG
jgi:hypothetical protein